MMGIIAAGDSDMNMPKKNRPGLAEKASAISRFR
jgi:hypothetical protein